MRDGDRLALSRLLSTVERDPTTLPDAIGAVQPHLGHAYRVGFTGPPGAGKSTLIDALIPLLRQDGRTVAVLAVDPTSPFTGGAVLGDRVRMQRHALDDGVFIRSVATRGSRGGLSRTARAATHILDAAGFDFILLETVGVGQTELGVLSAVDCVAVTLVPEAGDAVQALKAGLMEIGDVFVINKSDREGAGQVAVTVKSEVHASARRDWWTPPVVQTQAHNGEGVDALLAALEAFRGEAEKTSNLTRSRARRRRTEFDEALREAVEARLREATDGPLAALLDDVERGDVDPYSAAARAMGDQEVTADLGVDFHESSAGTASADIRGASDTVLGVDLTSFERKPTACAVLDSTARLLFVDKVGTDNDILDLAAEYKATLVAIDAPLGLPQGMDCLEETCDCQSAWPHKGRKADREIIARGISIYVITKRTFIKPMVYRAIALKAALEERGHRVIEVYPHASKVSLFGSRPPKKTTSAGQRFIHGRLRGLVDGLDGQAGTLTHDHYDAVVAAYTGLLHSAGRTETLGLADEGAIVVPAAAP